MIKKGLFGFFNSLHDFLHKPLLVFICCLGVAFVSLVIEGSLIQLWSLHRDFEELRQKKIALVESSEKMTLKIQKATEPGFIEREARDRFDLVNEGDLVFVFTDED